MIVEQDGETSSESRWLSKWKSFGSAYEKEKCRVETMSHPLARWAVNHCKG